MVAFPSKSGQCFTVEYFFGSFKIYGYWVFEKMNCDIYSYITQFSYKNWNFYKFNL